MHPKREATAAAGASSSPSHAKRVKFRHTPQDSHATDHQRVSDNDDDDVEELEYGKKKRNAIKEGYTESDDEDGNGGYDSDEDDAPGAERNEEAKDEKKQAIGGAADADDDMFGDETPDR